MSAIEQKAFAGKRFFERSVLSSKLSASRGRVLARKVGQRVCISAGILSRFVLLGFMTTLPLLAIFVASVEAPESITGFAYLASVPTYYFWVLLLSTFIFLPLFAVSSWCYFAIVPKVLLDAFLLADIVVYSTSRFHIDELFINTVVSDVIGLDVSKFAVAVTILLLLVVLGINLIIFAYVKSACRWRSIPPQLLLLLIFLVGQSIHIWAYEYKREAITRYTSAFPYYQPLTSHLMMSWLQRGYPTIFPSPEAAQTSALFFTSEN